MARGRRYREKRREGFYRYMFAVGRKFEEPKPAVSPVSHPTSTECLRVKEHLRHNLAGGIFISAKADGTPKVVRYSDVSAKYETNVRRRLNELFPDCFTVVDIAYLITRFVHNELVVIHHMPHIRVRRDDTYVVCILGTCEKRFRPGDCSIAGGKLQRHEQQVSPARCLHAVSCVFECFFTISIDTTFDEDPFYRGVAFNWEKIGKFCPAVFSSQNSVIVITGAWDIGKFSIKACKAV